MECSDHRSVCLSTRICQLVAIFALVRSFVRSLYAFSLSHLWRRRRSRPSVPRCFFFAASYCGQRPQRRRRGTLALALAFVSVVLSCCFCFRCRCCVCDYSYGLAGWGEGGQTKPATAINNRRHAAASLCTICLSLFVVVLFCFWSPAACS